MNTITRKLRKASSVIWLLIALILFFIRPVWEARLFSIAFGFCSATPLFFICGLHPKTEFLGPRAKIFKVASPRVIKINLIVIRVLTIVAAIYCFIYSSLLFQDMVGVLRYGKSSLITIEGVPLYNRPIFGMNFLNQRVLIRKQNGDEENFSFYFFPIQIHIGKFQKFFIAPHSKEVLDAELLN